MGVYLHSLYPADAEEVDPGFVIGYGEIATDRIEEGLARFRGAPGRSPSRAAVRVG